MWRRTWMTVQATRTMPRKRRGQPVHGWVNIDKPLGVTSTQAVGIVRRAFDAQKAGHAGTLDPPPLAATPRSPRP